MAPQCFTASTPWWVIYQQEELLLMKSLQAFDLVKKEEELTTEMSEESLSAADSFYN